MSDPTLRLFDQLAEKEQQALSKAFDTRHVTIAACGDLLKNTVKTLRDRGWTTHEPIWNAALFLNTVSYDLSICMIDLVYERDIWKRRYIARSLALLLFEIGEDITTVFGRQFRQAATTLGVSKDQLNAIGDETKKFSVFWNDHRKLLKEIRTVASAHRDHDAIVLHESIDGIDLFNLLGLAVKLGSLTNSLGAATQQVVNFTSEITPPELN
ncbi:MAG: hypothetical protein ACSHX9_08365 [Luteolibacter sp.]